MPSTITEDRYSSSVASDKHTLGQTTARRNQTVLTGLTALDFDHAVAERVSRDTTSVALAIAAASVATIQEHEVQPRTIPEPGLLPVGLFANDGSRRPFGLRNRCGVHDCILLERGSVKRHSSSGETGKLAANLRPLRWFSLVRPVVGRAALTLAGRNRRRGVGRSGKCRGRAGGKHWRPMLVTQLV